MYQLGPFNNIGPFNKDILIYITISSVMFWSLEIHNGKFLSLLLAIKYSFL